MDKFAFDIDDPNEKLEMFANAGNVEAQEFLGAKYRTGWGFGEAPDREKAMYWYEMAANNGSISSKSILEYMKEHPEDGVLDIK